MNGRLDETPGRQAGSLVVRGALLPRPDGGVTAPHDLHVAGGRIGVVAPSGGRAPTGATVLDAGGRLALPGFVDAHVHGDAAVLDPQVQHAMLRQGVTSIIVGQDGVGPAPSDERTCAWATRYFAAINGTHPTFRGGSVAELLATYERTTAINVATMVPHGTLRYLVTGAAQRSATADEVARMTAALRRALDDGAAGLSTGLEYVPAAWADEAELVALTRVVAERGLPHVSHMRGYEAAAPAAFAELARIARATGVATHVAHLHGPLDLITAGLGAAAAEGLDVTFDSYPYLRGLSLLSMVALPRWLPLADPDATVAALRDPAVLGRLHAEHLAGLDDLWPCITLASLPTGGADGGPAGDDAGTDLAWAEGLSLLDVAAALGVAPADAACRLLVDTGLRASCVFAQPPTNTPESVRGLLDHPAQLAASDAIYVPAHGRGRPHPRGWGAFARLLAARVLGTAIDLHDGAGTGDAAWTWSDAVEHLSARAARRFRLAGRGSLAPGSAADLVLVDPSALRDEATYADPRRPASGIDDVLVAGVPVLAAGELTGANPGRPLRPDRRHGAVREERASTETAS